MAKTKNKPGIHLLEDWAISTDGRKPYFYWHIVSKNGRIIARSSETYSRKSGAVKSIKVAASIFILNYNTNGPMYYDHSKPDSPLQSYL
jgi:uncharacterized protein YegP (UPF0339 family)